jgi:hypothetical protein
MHIAVRHGNSSRSFKGTQKQVTIGKAPSCDLLLPFAFLHDQHLIIDNSSKPLRARVLASDAVAVASGRRIGTDWTDIAAPARIEIPSPRGSRIFLEISSAPTSDLGAVILRTDSAGNVAEGLDMHVATQSAVAAGGGAYAEPEGMHEEPIDELDQPLRRPLGPVPPKLAIWGAVALYVLLIGGALLFNQHRREEARQAVENDRKEMEEQLARTNELIRAKKYAAANAALDAAEAAATRQPTLAASLPEIKRMREKPEIRLGANGYELLDDQWVPSVSARAQREARQRDDPKIAQLERDAASARASKKFDQARSACEQAIALMDAMPIKPHPRLAAVQTQLATIRDEAVAAEMTAKGLVQFQGKWVTKEEKFKMEQVAKGLVEYQGQWMTKEQVAEAQAKPDSGRVFYKGKWMTQDEKMIADGNVQFEGKWVKVEEKNKILAARKAEEEAAKLAEARAEAMKKIAYASSQDFVRTQLSVPKTAQFQAFDGDKVSVVLDDGGWYIVRGIVVMTQGKASRVYFCKLRPKDVDGKQWEAETTVFAD